MKIRSRSFRHHARSLTATLLFLASSGVAWADTYDPGTNKLTIRTVIIGGASFSNMVVTIGSIVSAPSGTAPNAGEDAYDTASHHLTIPQVTVLGGNTYYNVVVTVANLVSSGTLSGSDSFDGTQLTIPYVQVGSNVYFHVVITVGSVVSHGSGMPQNPRDVFDPSTHHLSIASVLYGGITYTNLVIIPGTIKSVGGLSPQVTFSASSLSFSCLTYCTPRTVALINAGATILIISEITTSGKIGNYSLFSESNNCPGSLGAGESCAIAVKYMGPAQVAGTGDLIVTDNGAGSPQMLPLHGYIY